MDEGFEAAQWAMQTATSATMTQAARRAEAASPALARLWQERQVVQDRLIAEEAELAAAARTEREPAGHPPQRNGARPTGHAPIRSRDGTVSW